MKNCDKCNSSIVKGKCSCGIWIETPESRPSSINIFEQAILEYNKMGNNDVLTGDHHSGTCIILFKGNYKKCMKIKQFIQNDQ